MAARRKLADRIVDTVLELAEEGSWDGLRLHAVADRLGISLAELRRHYRDADAIADAWLARADLAALACREDAGFDERPPPERLYLVIMRWLDSLGGHRRVTRQIFAAKGYFGHPHHNLKLVTWTSRTVQWLREAAGLNAGGRRRQVEEIGLTVLFVATLALWLRDESEGQERTRRFLNRRLKQADRVMARLWPRPRGDNGDALSPSPSRRGGGRRPRARSPA